MGAWGTKREDGGRELGLRFPISLGARTIGRMILDANRIADLVTRRIYFL